MISMDTRVFHRAIQESRQDAISAAKPKVIKAIKELMAQTYRFGTFDDKYNEEIAKGMVESFLGQV